MQTYTQVKLEAHAATKDFAHQETLSKAADVEKGRFRSRGPEAEAKAKESSVDSKRCWCLRFWRLIVYLPRHCPHDDFLLSFIAQR